ncbi:hypothetical protein CWE09_05235 [Aliidiomarina minuta]|uniref:Regulatory protein RecX n=1 Tax=Aliidiomarina minuta TaxID=880057 RepID=A0A432W958_9GAMM|nr:regulatory protein RecX [Aliidiomarina minuta]RUO26128.1 hypothetical protein CWE09_05235 [Aliidiomarina minuta]
MKADAEEDVKAIEHRAVHLLGRREHSAAELKRKLRQKGFAAEPIDEVLELLAERGWQSDQRFTESYIRQRIENGYGPLKIRFDLQQKGIASSMIEELLAAQETDWVELARQRYVRRFGETPAADEKERARRLRHLYQRGFLPDQVRTAYHRIEQQEG